VTNTYDCHTLVEVYTDGDWRLVDPTFGLIPHNAGDSSIATGSDVRAATRAQTWGDITYEFVTPRGSGYVTTDYIDWPLYFVNLYVGGQEDVIDGDIEQDVLTKYYVPIGTATTYGSYVLQCPEGQSQGQVIADGVAQALDCPMLGMSHVQPYQSLVPTDGGVVWAPQRFVFQWDGSWPGRP
jgi:hypothetical protein